jgi:hypothetical protein
MEGYSGPIPRCNHSWPDVVPLMLIKPGRPPVVLTLSELVDALGTDPESLHDSLKAGVEIGVVELRPRAHGLEVTLIADVAELLGLEREAGRWFVNEAAAELARQGAETVAPPEPPIVEPDPLQGLDERQRRFVRAYRGEARGDAVAAARMAGCAFPTTDGPRMLKKRSVARLLRDE